MKYHEKNCKRCGGRFSPTAACNLFCSQNCRDSGRPPRVKRPVGRYAACARCSVENCGIRPYARGYCKRHYYRFKRHGDPLKRVIVRADEKVNENGLVWCARCKEWIARSEFGKWLACWCKQCRRLERYKLSRSEYKALLDRTGGVCPICQIRPATAIDHDHACCSGRSICGRCVRGVLCKNCNAALGVLTDQGVLRAVEYLGRHGGKAA